jgi:putative spermidine/putrescine transport system ATP-binding protein
MSDSSKGASLRLSNLAKSYEGTNEPAVDGVDLAVEQGEFLTLLGPSGSGKTTTLNMVAGFVKPSEGQIELDGQQVGPLPPHRRNIGVVFQQYALFPHLTAAANISFPLKQRKLAKTEVKRQVEEVLNLVQMTPFASRYPRELSGGQQQRVALARALVFGPRLVLMDEPLGALDRKLRDSLQREIKRIHEELGTTFIYVTHDQDEALVMSDRIAVFNEGRIEQIGTPAHLYEHPSSVFVARFLGESNVFDGVIEKTAVRCGEFNAPADTEGFQDGDHVSVVVRPENVQLAVQGDERASSGVVEGSVIESTYLGSIARVEVAISGGTRVVSRVDVDTAARCTPGIRVCVGWSVEKSVVLPEGEPQAVESGDVGLAQ